MDLIQSLIPLNNAVLLHTPEGIIDMRETGNYTFEAAEGDTIFSFEITASIEASFTLSLRRGWNMFSLPVRLENNSVT